MSARSQASAQRNRAAAESTARAEALAAATEDASERASTLRDRFLADSIEADDLAELADSAVLVDRFLDDVREVVKQLYIAGVAYPDPDLPEELEGLAERAARHGLAGALEHLVILRAELEALAGETHDLFVRADRSEAVWQRAQRLVAWLRMFRQEHDLVTVQSRLTRQAQAEAAGESVLQRKPRLPVASLDVWPVGLQRRGSKLTILARDVETGRRVALVDELADVPPHGPFAGLVISRLFRDQIDLGVLLGGLIRLDQHPYVETGPGRGQQRTLMFRPAFIATPRPLPVARNFVAPALEAGPSGGRPYRIPLEVSRQSTGALQLLTTGGESAGVYVGRTLRANLLKLLVREGGGTQTVDATLLQDSEAHHLLAVSTDYDERVFPVDDLRLFRLDRVVLARRAHEDAIPQKSASGVCLRAGAYLYGGAEPEPMATFRSALGSLKSKDLTELWRLNLLRGLFGEEPVSVAGTAKRALGQLRQGVKVKRSTSQG